MGQPFVLQLIHEAEIALALSLGSWVVLFPVRAMFSKFKHEWKSKSEMLKAVHTELAQQRTNCLTTLQSQGDEQVKLLTKVSETLDDMRLSQSEMVGYLKGSRK